MIIQQPLLISAFLLSALISFSVMSEEEHCSKKFEVLERTKGKKYEFVNRDLKNLFCKDGIPEGKFEGKYFKIVHGTNEEAITFDYEDKEIAKRAANVYYHVSIARKFFVDEIKSQYVKDMHQLTIRLDITNAFSRTRHFKNEGLEQNYNNAWSIPAGQTPRFIKERKVWNKEIWFSPIKKINARDLVKSKGRNPIHESLKLIKDPLIDFSKNGLLYQGLGLIASPSIGDSDYLVSAIQKVGIIAVLYGLIKVTKHMDKWFVDKYFYIDTALVPDIIYHEYAHIALSDSMKTVHSVPVIEGMADYFAARIIKEKHLFKKLKGISTNRSKNRKSKEFYHPYLEQPWNANSDFTLSFLWLVRTELEKVNAKRVKRGRSILVDVDELIHQTHFSLNEESNIFQNLSSALINTCKKICKNKRLGVSALNTIFEKKGL